MAKKDRQEQYREKHRFWQAHIHAWERSGLSQVAYCRCQNLRPNQFCYWKKKFTSLTDQCRKSRFVPVPVTAISDVHSENDSGLELHVGSVIIKLKSNFNGKALSRVVSNLGHKS